MKLNEKVKYVTCGVVAGAMLMTTAPAIASQATKSISATYNNIKIVVDGRQVTTDSHNEPFIYNGTTYLPVRAVGEAVGKAVTWDGATNTVYLGDNPVSDNGQYLVDVCPPYQNGRTYETVKMAGKTYMKALGVENGSPALINLDGKYTTMEFVLGHGDGFDEEEEYNFYVDGVLVKTITLEKGQMPTQYSIPLNYGLQLKIDKVVGPWLIRAALANCIVK